MIRSSCSRAFNVNIPFLSISRSKNGNLFMASPAGNARPFPRRVQRSFHSHHMIRQGQETDLESADKNASSIALQKSVQVNRKTARSAASKRSMREATVKYQRQDVVIKDGESETAGTNTVTAICAAEEYDMKTVVRLLRSHGFCIDPYDTSFTYDQVVHTRGINGGDIFVFPSGCLVAWGLPEDVAVDLATVTLLPAAQNPHVKTIEMEDLDFKEDPNRENSSIRGDVITIGTRGLHGDEASELDMTLSKTAFSSGLARSTKLGVLENLLSAYLESTRQIPILLSKGSQLPYTRSFLLQKTGELLEMRAQLNHYSELTDSLPDLFWDSKHGLGLEDYFDQAGRALDVGVRIRTLNQKLDYAQETAAILRETLSERHSDRSDIYSKRLEWIIILLIAVEVAFGGGLWTERQARLASEAAEKHT